MENLAATLSYLMSEKGIKSAELARKTGIGQPVIYRLMTGTTENPQILTLKPLADFFGVTVDQLLGIHSLSNQIAIDNTAIQELHNKITTIKTITSVLVDLMPALVEGYKKAAAANLVGDDITTDILPLLPLNCTNLQKAINQIQEILSNKNTTRD